ncbi:MAG: hypothetical protein AAF679_13200 [Pseudomonadota bacterium]
MGKASITCATCLAVTLSSAMPIQAQTVQVPGVGALDCGLFLSALGPSVGVSTEETKGVSKGDLSGPKTAAKTGEGPAATDDDEAAFSAQLEPRQPPRPRDKSAGPPGGRDMAEWLAYCQNLVAAGQG